MNEMQFVEEDEISLFDLLQRLREGWKIVLGITALGVAVALCAIFSIPSKYEAVAIVQVGLVGQISPLGQGGQVGQLKVTGIPIETPMQTVERMKTSAFQSRVAETLGDRQWAADITRSNSGSAHDLTLQVIKATLGSEQVPLIDLRASGPTREAAQKKAEAVISQLGKVHADLAQPAIARMRTDLAISREKLASAERDLESLTKLMSSASVKDDRFTQLALVTSLRIEKEADTFNQRQMIMALETALAAPATQPVRAIESVFVADKPASPKKALLLALGLVGGLLVGVMWVFVADAWKRARERRSAV
ncbi:Wzz/FepE/Etk N-terminal domain-containing protein [Propionivibrio sp.]|uniref:Wzz/FepE/Etk N-terminal domain-containing protein n=1 Tax=Propionivibrio sp. TaxID=2212460 RepID=UPI0039E51A36